MSTRSLLIIWVVGPSLSRAPLAWKAAWNSVSVIGGLPLLPHHTPPPRFVLDVISEGYKLPLIRVPDPCFKTNNRSAELHPSFVKEAFIKLLAADCSEECLEPPYRVNLLSVAEGKKLRPVIDLRHVNSFLFRHSFKYEDLHSLSKG